MRGKNDGFTLLEVMIAMSILAMALVAVFQMQSQSISMATDARFLTTASLLAQGKMADIEADTALANTSATGDFSPDYPDYGWSLSVTDTPQVAKLKRVELNVFNRLFADGRPYQLIFYKMSGM